MSTNQETRAPDASIDWERMRRAFPSLGGETVFMENAGGSQVPAVVANAIRDYMLESYVQLGAGYAESKRATDVVAGAHSFANMLMNGDPGSSEIVLGPSSTVLVRTLAEAYGRTLDPGSEIVIAENGHESNIGPWVDLEARGMQVRWWKADPEHKACTLEGLRNVLSGKTAVVAFPHVSNLLGEIVDVPAITALAHEAGAKVVVDGVAYAPHRAIDVRAWDVDWYFYSAYKVYGPHMAALYGTHAAFAGLPGPNHFFIANDDIPYKFEPGGVSHEGCAGLLALGQYLRYLCGAQLEEEKPCDRSEVERAFALMTACEQALQKPLIDALISRDDISVIGPAHAEATRVPTISFRHRSIASQEIASRLDPTGIAIRAGHMYAHRLCKALSIPVADGVVRISLVHYNTPAEVARLIAELDKAFEE